MATTVHSSIPLSTDPENISARIFLVEDERIVALDLADTLYELGYNVVGSVRSGEAAIEQVAELHPDLVLMDIRLAGETDGIRAAQQIKKAVDVPIIYLTAHSDEATLARAKSTKPSGYLVKPFKAPDLRCAIEIALHKHEMECRMRESEARLRQAEKIEDVARLTGGIAHEFNNLLSIVLGYAEILAPDLAGNEQQCSSVEGIRKAAKRAVHLTRQLLAFSRGQVLLPQVVDLNIVLADTCRMVLPLIGDGIDLAFVPTRESIWVRVDPAQFHQIISNLMTNAAEAMPEGGKVTIEVGAADLKDEHLAQHLGLVAGQYATMAITDTGRGMTPEVKARAFQPFFTTKEFGKGPGLGLAAVHGIVNQSGGSISIRSQLGIGTTFTIYLPQVAEQEKRAETGMPLRPSSESLLGSEIILVVENHPQLRTLFRECLDTLGYKVLTANLGTEAIRIAEELRQDIHLLVTDVLLTDMNGRQLVKQLKTFHRNMKVIYVSGYSDSAFGRPGEPASGDVLMEKPFALEKLARTIRHMLDGKTSSATEQPGVLDVVEPLP